MSTFRGVVQEFPDIRIDFFRPMPGMRPPRKCFLSHVHSDHLAGLETPSFNSCFIYCSAATREILLRLEKYPQRLNFRKGILEKPPKVTYKHLDKLLKPIPLETPTRIELEPGNYIQVTLFDANHCTGAVMFLIEGNDKAILYTGDVRSEPWFVNNLTRNPFLIEYTSRLKTLDCIYLDTSNTRDISFPPKADGLKELLQKVSKYPADTVFHFTAWTFGYEEVWMALSRTLKSRIHVDDYKMRLYASLRGKPKNSIDDTYLSGPFLSHEGPALAGYKCGNALQDGYLTDDTNVRLHSCEKGLHCDKLDDKTVWIRPIVTRTAQGEMAEVGVGGGGGDLTQRLEIELDNEGVIDQFLGLFADTEDLVKMDIKRMLGDDQKTFRAVLSLDDLGLDPKKGDISLTQVAKALTRSITKKSGPSPEVEEEEDSFSFAAIRRRPASHPRRMAQDPAEQVQFEALPRLITFPYSRHASYPELCHLVRVFDPKDVYPCTVDEENWDDDVSMETLFSKHCSAKEFRHDDEMRAKLLLKSLKEEHHFKSNTQQTQTTATTEASSQIMPSSPLEEVNKATWNWGRLGDLGHNDRQRDPEVPGNALDGDGVNQHSSPVRPSTSRGPPGDTMPPPPNPSERRRERSVSPFTIRRDSQGRLRAFDSHGNQVILPAGPKTEELVSFTSDESLKDMQNDEAEMAPTIRSTPPKNINAVSPGSASQNLRRKAIHDGIEGQVKRARLSYDGPVSSPAVADSSGTPQVIQHASAVIEIPDDSEDDDDDDIPTPGSDADSPMQSLPGSHDPTEDASSVVSTADVEESQSPRSPYHKYFDSRSWNYDWGDPPSHLHEDEENPLLRCKECGHEMWTVWMAYPGFCTHCSDVARRDHSEEIIKSDDEGDNRCPYYEIIDSEAGPRPKIEIASFTTYHDYIGTNRSRQNIVGDYIDDHSDAYDTMDEDEEYRSEYDSEDCFIDDASIDEPQSEEENNEYNKKARGVDYKAMFKELQQKHTRLLNTHEGMIQDLLNSDYAYDSTSSEESYLSADDGIEEVDEYGAFVVDVNPPDLTVFELVLSEAQHESQQSEVTDNRIKDRVEAFEAAAGENWNNISLVSTGDNHTHAEIEL